jgi:hypothetical protein
MPMSPEQLAVVRQLITESRVVSLALIVEDAPVIGLLPFVATPDFRALVVHASSLARHSKGLHDGAQFDALLHEPVVGDVDPLRVKRLTLRGPVHVPEPGTPPHDALRHLYLLKYPEAELMTTLGDFAFYVLPIAGGRLVTDFGAAANVTADTLEALRA